MSDGFSNSELASKFDLPLTSVRRWAREFLGSDPARGMQSGKKRLHSPNGAFVIVLGGYLVTAMGFKINEVKTILRDIRPWMEREGLLPEKTREYAPKILARKRVISHELSIMRSTTQSGFSYRVQAVVHERMNPETGLIEMEYGEYPIASPPTGSSWTVNEGSRRILPIGILLGLFKVKTTGVG